MENSVTELSDGELQHIFYCGNCREIFGDSLSVVRVHEEFVSLQIATDAVVVTNTCETSIEGSDSGSTFKLLECKSCHGKIGRCYQTTPWSLDHIRGIYTLDLNKVKSYHVGSYTSTNNGPALKNPFDKFEETIMKMQSMLLALHERMEKIESCLEEVESGEELLKQGMKGVKKKRKTK